MSGSQFGTNRSNCRSELGECGLYPSTVVRGLDEFSLDLLAKGEGVEGAESEEPGEKGRLDVFSLFPSSEFWFSEEPDPSQENP